MIENQRPTHSRVCHVITQVSPSGGAERRVLDALLTAETEHAVLAGRVSPGRNLQAISERATIGLVPSLRRDVSPPHDVRGVWTLRKAILQASADIVHTHHSKAGVLVRLALATMPAHRRPRLVHSLSMASFGQGYSQAQSTVFRALEKFSQKWVDAYLVVGQDLLDTYAEIGIPRAKLHLVRSSQELGRWTATASTRDFSGSPVRLLFVGALDERKGVHLLPEIVRRVGKDHDVELTVVGTGAMSGLLERSIAEEGLPITLTGYRSDIAELMTDSDLLLLPSSVEGLPQVLVQSAANGLPTVSFDVHGTAELVSLGADCEIVSLRTAEAMATAVSDRVNRGRRDQVAVLPIAQWDQGHVVGVIGQIYASLVRSLEATDG